MLVRLHPHRLIDRAGHADMQIFEDQQLFRRAQVRHALFQQGLAKVRANTGAGLENGRPIGLLRPDASRGGPSGRDLGKGLNLFALNDHVQIVGRETAALIPSLAPDLGQ